MLQIHRILKLKSSKVSKILCVKFMQIYAEVIPYLFREHQQNIRVPVFSVQIQTFNANYTNFLTKYWQYKAIPAQATMQCAEWHVHAAQRTRRQWHEIKLLWCIMDNKYQRAQTSQAPSDGQHLQFNSSAGSKEALRPRSWCRTESDLLYRRLTHDGIVRVEHWSVRTKSNVCARARLWCTCVYLRKRERYVIAFILIAQS